MRLAVRRKAKAASPSGQSSSGSPVGSANQPATGFVERIHQGCEPLGHIPPLRRKPGNPIHEYRVEGPCHGKKIRRTEGHAADVFKVDPPDPAYRLRNSQVSPEDTENSRLRSSIPHSEAPGRIHLKVCLRAHRGKIPPALGGSEPVVPGPLDLVEIETLFNQRDERKEEIAVQPVAVEVFGWPVGGDHHRHAVPKQRLEELSQDHRVHDVLHLELIET